MTLLTLPAMSLAPLCASLNSAPHCYPIKPPPATGFGPPGRRFSIRYPFQMIYRGPTLRQAQSKVEGYARTFLIPSLPEDPNGNKGKQKEVEPQRRRDTEKEKEKNEDILLKKFNPSRLPPCLCGEKNNHPYPAPCSTEEAERSIRSSQVREQFFHLLDPRSRTHFAE